jgi:hypothetical protein
MAHIRIFIFTLVLLGSLLFFNSCNVVNRVYFEVLRPADTVINLKSREIDLVNQHFRLKPQAASEKEYDKWRLDSLVSFECIRAVYQVISETERFIPARVDTVYNRSSSARNRIELRNVDLKTTVLKDPVRDYYTGLYTAVVRVDYQVDWAIVNSANQVVFNSWHSDTVWVEGSKARFTNLYDLVNFDKAVKHIVKKTGKGFAESVAPHWRGTYRYIYASGHNDFVVADTYVSQNQWSKAENMWIKHLNSNNRNLAGKANYNMAVKSEKEGLLLKALEYAQMALEKHSFEPARELVSILQARIRNVGIIEGQIP